MTELTIPQIEEKAARAEKATPGPLHRSGCRHKIDGQEFLTVNGPDGKYWALIPYVDTLKGQAEAIADGEFLAHSRADIPALCSTALSAIRERDRLEGLFMELEGITYKGELLPTPRKTIDALIRRDEEIEALTRERDALRAALKAAPHGPFCTYLRSSHQEPCDCRKSQIGAQR